MITASWGHNIMIARHGYGIGVANWNGYDVTRLHYMQTGMPDQDITWLVGFLFEFTALMVDGDFIEKIERRAEFFDRVNDIAAADAEMTSVIHLSG